MSQKFVLGVLFCRLNPVVGWFEVSFIIFRWKRVRKLHSPDWPAFSKTSLDIFELPLSIAQMQSARSRYCTSSTGRSVREWQMRGLESMHAYITIITCKTLCITCEWKLNGFSSWLFISILDFFRRQKPLGLHETIHRNAPVFWRKIDTEKHP